MTFDEWWTSNFPDGTAYGISRVAWEAALEEAATVASKPLAPTDYAEKYSNAIADMIRALK